MIGSPAFDRADVVLDNGRTLNVVARGNGGDNVYVQSLKVNGRPWDRAWLRHDDIAGGGTLEFVMGDAPSAWGSGADALPPSMTAPGRPPSGLVDRSADAAGVVLDGDHPAVALVDDDASTSLRLPAQATVGIRFRAPVAISHYTLTSGGEPLPGLDWTLEGRNESGAWTTLDQRRGESFPWARQLRPFRVDAPGDYAEYRLRLANDAPIDLAELELLQSGAITRTARTAPPGSR